MPDGDMPDYDTPGSELNAIVDELQSISYQLKDNLNSIDIAVAGIDSTADRIENVLDDLKREGQKTNEILGDILSELKRLK